MIPHVVLISIPLITNDIGHLFMFIGQGILFCVNISCESFCNLQGRGFSLVLLFQKLPHPN